MKMFKIDALLAAKGYTVFRLPPYHPNLNPIEMVWATFKNYVAKKNASFQLCDTIKLI